VVRKSFQCRFESDREYELILIGVRIKNMLTNIFQTSFYWHFPAPNAEEILKKIEGYGEEDVNNSLFSWMSNCTIDLVPLNSVDWIDLICPSLNHISNIMNTNFGYTLVDLWLNFYKRNSFQELHEHGPYDISFVFFANDGEGFSKFMFLDRNSTSLSNSIKEFIGYEYTTNVNYKKGDILFFPSTLLHGVSVHNSDKVRISLSGNLNIYDICPK